MAGASHDILVMALRERPYVLQTLLEYVAEGQEIAVLTQPLAVEDSAVRFADVKEVRPDLVFSSSVLPWMIVEVQHEIDDVKQRRWPLAVSVLLDQHRQMGELIVLTPHRRVARWACKAVRWNGPLGTTLSMSPFVLWVSPDVVDQLLENDSLPELALIVAWALQNQSGPRARKQIKRVVEQTGRLSEPLRSEQTRAILQMISKPLLEYIRTMNLDQIPESEAFKEFKQSLQVEGERNALLRYLAQRKVALTTEQRSKIETCNNQSQLEQWMDALFAASSPEQTLRQLF